MTLKQSRACESKMTSDQVRQVKALLPAFEPLRNLTAPNGKTFHRIFLDKEWVVIESARTCNEFLEGVLEVYREMHPLALRFQNMINEIYIDMMD